MEQTITAPTEGNNAGFPTVAVWDYFCAPDDLEWRVKRAWKRKVILTPTRHTAPDRETTRAEMEAEGYIKAEVPRMLKKGQVLYSMGTRCVVDGFQTFGLQCVLLSGDWLKCGTITQNAAPISHLEAYAVRLPYPHELAREEVGNNRTLPPAAGRQE